MVEEALAVFAELKDIQLCTSMWAVTEMVNILVSRKKIDRGTVAEIESQLKYLRIYFVEVSPRKDYDFAECFYHVKQGILKYHSGVGDVIHSVIMESNGKAQVVEAQTVNTSSPSTIVTDEFFSYSKRGELTDVYESTPHSGGYYHSTASYWATGALQSLGGIPGVPTINYGANGVGLDGEGRYTQVTAASGTNPATNVAYSSSTTNALGALTGVTFGSADSDNFAYDPNTGRLTAYSFSVNSKTDSGTLNWNPNGTLKQLAIIDNITSTTDTQTCNYFYDDLERLGGKNANGYSVDCGTKWQQLFTFDAFGNIDKSGTATFSPTYSSATNRFASIPGVTVQYDANGNLLTDNLNTYTWDKNWGNPASVNSTNLIYDALGRMVEKQNGSTYTEILYSPVGKTALMNGQTLSKAFIGLPGGATAIYNSSGLAYYRHSDWLGSSRLTSTQARTLYSSSAYAPFGEQYVVSGTADASFTGQNSDTASSLYDFTFREDSPSQGRWLSPDPSGLAAVSLTNPQSWNRYAYVLNNPLALVDPLGLGCVYLNPDGTVARVVADGDCAAGSDGFYFDGTISTDTSSYYVTPNGDVLGMLNGSLTCEGECPAAGLTVNDLLPPDILTTPAAYQGGPLSQMPTVSAWRAPKSKNYITAPPGPYKPSVTQCVTAPNDTAEEILGNSVRIEHNPAATGLVYQSTSRGTNPTVSPETVEGANAFAVFFAGAMNMVGCLANAF